jgi:diacylglycerol kinase family enzyme
MNNVLIVTNFSAGRKKAIKYKKRIQKFLLIRQVHFRFIDIDQLSEIDMEDFDTILVVGGDGTVNKVLPYIKDKTLGIIPAGTANLLAAKLGITSVSKALRAIDKGNIKQIDLMYINDKPTILRSGFGYDSDIICKTPQTLKNKFGYFSYFIAGILFALRLKNKLYKIVIDGENREIKSSCIIVANADNMYRNWVSIAKSSNLDDGFFEIFILKTQNPILFLFEFLKILFNIKNNSSIAEYIKTNNLIIKNTCCVAHIDGEKTLLMNDLNYIIKEKTINIYCDN